MFCSVLFCQHSLLFPGDRVFLRTQTLAILLSLLSTIVLQRCTATPYNNSPVSAVHNSVTGVCGHTLYQSCLCVHNRITGVRSHTRLWPWCLNSGPRATSSTLTMCFQLHMRKSSSSNKCHAGSCYPECSWRWEIGICVETTMVCLGSESNFFVEILRIYYLVLVCGRQVVKGEIWGCAISFHHVNPGG